MELYLMYLICKLCIWKIIYCYALCCYVNFEILKLENKGRFDISQKIVVELRRKFKFKQVKNSQ